MLEGDVAGFVRGRNAGQGLGRRLRLRCTSPGLQSRAVSSLHPWTSPRVCTLQAGDLHHVRSLAKRLVNSDPSRSQHVDAPELFFACSATRDRRHCPLYIKLSDRAARLHKQPALPLPPPCPRDAAADERTIDTILAAGDCSAEFCSTCSTLLTASSSAVHALHNVVSIRNLFTPSRSLPNLGVDDASAQCVCLPFPHIQFVTIWAGTSFPSMPSTICSAYWPTPAPALSCAWAAPQSTRRLSPLAPAAYENIFAFTLVTSHVICCHRPCWIWTTVLAPFFLAPFIATTCCRERPWYRVSATAYKLCWTHATS